MILDKAEIDSRLSNPDNLLNRLRLLTKPSSNTNQIVSIPNSAGIIEHNNHPSLPPPIEELVEDIDDKVNTAKCYKGAKEVLASSISRLSERLNEVDSPVQLSRIATDMGKIVSGFDENRKEKIDRTIPVIYRPVMMTENNFQIVNVNE